jgi:hypothetical protein
MSKTLQRFDICLFTLKIEVFMISNRIPYLVLATLPVILLVSCAGQSTQSTPSAQDQKTELCTNLARLNTAVAALKSISPSSTVGDFKAAQDQVKLAFADVKSSARSVQEAKAGELEQAHTALDQAVAAVPATATLNQAAESIAPQVAAVESAEAQMKSGLNCP